MTEEGLWRIVPIESAAGDVPPGIGALQAFRLSEGGVRKLERLPQLIRVRSGCAWITIDGEDIIVESGQEIHLTRSDFPGVISNLCDQLLVYEVL